MKSKVVEKIDRYSPMPVYQQIANDMIARIAQEEWIIGGKLPSESELSEEYGASRVTVRQALAKLEADGLIDKQRGRGAFLKANRRRNVLDLFLPQIGVTHESDIVSTDAKINIITSASAQVVTNLGVAPGTPLVYVERFFVRKKKVVGINRAWFPLNIVPGMSDQGLIDNSLTKTLQQRYHIEFGSVENYIESVMLDAAMAQQFDTVSPSPALKISSIYSLADGTPIEYAVTIWNGRDTQFHVQFNSK